MRPLSYRRAATVDDALTALGHPAAVALAGGTELLNWLRLGIADSDRIEQVVDIRRLPGWDAIEDLTGGGLRIGAAVTLHDLAEHARVRADWPVLREAIHSAASAQLRNLATIGGNLLQKTRCAYFRSEGGPITCNRRVPGSGCGAAGGYSERHALFGWTADCGATLPSDPAVALAALDAVVVARGNTGQRRIPVRDLHVLPAQGLDVDTVLRPGELIEAIELPAAAPHGSYLKVRERTSYEYALVSAAVTVDLGSDGALTTVRIALGSVALRPWRLDAAERSLAGRRPDDPDLAGIIAESLAPTRAFGDSGYKGRLAAAAAHRALVAAAGTAS